MKKLVLVLTTIALIVTMVFSVSAKTKVKSVKVKGNPKKVTLTVGQKKTYTVKVKATKKNRGFKVKSSNKKIVKVTKKGKKITVEALKKGSAKITVTSKKNKKKKYKFTVNVNYSQSVIDENNRLAEEEKKYWEQHEKEMAIFYEQQKKAQEQAKIYEEQGLKAGEDYYFGMGNDNQGMICVLKYKQTYIDDELMADFNKDRAIVNEKCKSDPNYKINKSTHYFKEKDVHYYIAKDYYYLDFKRNHFITYGCYNDTGELPTPDNYDYKRVDGEVVEGVDYNDVIVYYDEGEPVYGVDWVNLRKHKYTTEIAYDVYDNLVEILKSPN